MDAARGADEWAASMLDRPRQALPADPWLDAHEAAAYTGLSESRLRDLARLGELREDGRALPERKLYGDEDPNVLRGHELGAFLTALREQSPGFYPLIVVMALTGLRTSEATALRWGDLEGDILVVQRSAVRGHIRERTKTDVARRVPLAPVLVEVLREQRARLEEDARALSRRRGEIVQPSPWMFPSRTGQPRYGTTLAKPIKRALRAAEIALRFTPHGLRRTLNDLLRGVATADVQKAITGHSTEAMREHYAHVRVEARAEALGAVAAVVPLRRSGA